MMARLSRDEVLALVFGLPADLFGIGEEYDFGAPAARRDEPGDAPVARVIPFPSKERR
jgi:hypothetical protein